MELTEFCDHGASIEYGTLTTIEGPRAAAPTPERRAALAEQRAALVSSDSKVGQHRPS